MNKNYGYGYMNDSEISKVSGGLSTTKKVIIGVSAAVAALGAAYAGKTVYNRKKSNNPAPSWGQAANPFSKAWWTGNNWKNEEGDGEGKES
jgi:hypothetical protein